MDSGYQPQQSPSVRRCRHLKVQANILAFQEQRECLERKRVLIIYQQLETKVWLKEPSIDLRITSNDPLLDQLAKNVVFLRVCLHTSILDLGDSINKLMIYMDKHVSDKYKMDLNLIFAYFSIDLRYFLNLYKGRFLDHAIKMIKMYITKSLAQGKLMQKNEMISKYFILSLID